MRPLIGLVLASLLGAPGVAAAGSPRPMRRVERQELDRVTVRGRAAKPAAVIEIERTRPRFKVGTARYERKRTARER